MKTFLLIFFAFWVTVVKAGEVDLLESTEIADGKGLVVFSIDAPDTDEFVYRLSYKSIGGRRPYRDNFSFGKSSLFYDRSPNLTTKYGLSYRGRLMAIELPPDEYVIETMTIESVPKGILDPNRIKTSDGSLNVRFDVDEGKAKYLGHWELEVGDTQYRAGTLFGLLFLGADLGGFSFNLKVSDKFDDVRQILAKYVPLVHNVVELSLIKSSAVSRNFHPLDKYPQSAYAKLEDVNALPLKESTDCRKMYEKWLLLKTPRAFAVGQKKGCALANGNQAKITGDSPIPAERVLALCARNKQGPCKLYAVDDRVVYVAPPNGSAVTEAHHEVKRSEADVPFFHSLEEYPATGFANISDVAAVPLNGSEGCRKHYENWLRQKSPRAFAVGLKKGCGFTWGLEPKTPGDSAIPAERATAACERVNGTCLLYAVDDRVVYKTPE